jgi:hypothetical protein
MGVDLTFDRRLLAGATAQQHANIKQTATTITFDFANLGGVKVI